MKHFHLNNKEIIFITDTLGDIRAANKLGIKTIAVDFGYHERARLENGNPQKIISNFKDILPAVQD
jgi:phosphoglycolate phosphatase-like HAD superfamily hydrolase